MTNYAHHGTGVGSHADLATKYERSFRLLSGFVASLRMAASIPTMPSHAAASRPTPSSGNRLGGEQWPCAASE
jgi:hypothetical protein